MEIQATEQLLAKKCLPCEGGVEPYSLEESEQQLAELAGWELTGDNQRIRKEWTVTNFMAGMDFFNRVAEVAEEVAEVAEALELGPNLCSCVARIGWRTVRVIFSSWFGII